MCEQDKPACLLRSMKIINDLKIEQLGDGKWVVKQLDRFAYVVLSVHESCDEAYEAAEKYNETKK